MIATAMIVRVGDEGNNIIFASCYDIVVLISATFMYLCSVIWYNT